MSKMGWAILAFLVFGGAFVMWDAMQKPPQTGHTMTTPDTNSLASGDPIVGVTVPEELSFNASLGKRVFENISAEGWQMWVNHQTMLINEYRLNPMDPKAKELIIGEMEKFLFGEGSDLPADFVPEQNPDDPINEEF